MKASGRAPPHEGKPRRPRRAWGQVSPPSGALVLAVTCTGDASHECASTMVGAPEPPGLWRCRLRRGCRSEFCTARSVFRAPRRPQGLASRRGPAESAIRRRCAAGASAIAAPGRALDRTGAAGLGRRNPPPPHHRLTQAWSKRDAGNDGKNIPQPDGTARAIARRRRLGSARSGSSRAPGLPTPAHRPREAWAATWDATDLARTAPLAAAMPTGTPLLGGTGATGPRPGLRGGAGARPCGPGTQGRGAGRQSRRA